MNRLAWLPGWVLALTMLLLALRCSPAARAQTNAASANEPGATAAMPAATLYAFFATWCVPCRGELPHIQRLGTTYRDKGLAVVLVSEDAPSTAQSIPAFLARLEVTLPWILDDESELLERYNPSASLPFTVLVDSAGNVIYAHAGYEPGDERLLEAAIQKALAGAPAEQAAVQAAIQGLAVHRTSRFDPVPGSDGLVRAGVGRLEVSGTAERYAASVRVDGALVADPIRGDDQDARLERIQARAGLGPVTLTAGDDYVSFGHGVTLSLRKVEPLGLDTALRGGRVDVDAGRISVKALAGVANPQNLDPIELGVVEDTGDVLAGSEVEVRLGSGSPGDSGPVVAPYVLYAHADGAAADGRDVRWLAGGVSTTMTAGSVRMASELAAGTREGRALGGAETAWAGYGAVHWAGRAVSVLADAKAYRHWEIGRDQPAILYHEPPTLEREDQEVPANDNALGARARVEARPHERLALFGNALGYRYTQDGTSPVHGDLALHGYVGGELRLGADDTGTAGLQLGHRRELYAEGGTKLSLWHADLDAAWRLGRDWSLAIKWNHREETKAGFNLIEFRRGLAVTSLGRTGWGALALLYGYSTESASTPTHYPGGELLVHLPRGGSVRLFLGRQAGGRICVSGSCRDVPPFAGARLDLVMQL